MCRKPSELARGVLPIIIELIITFAILTASIYLLTNKTENGHAREAAMWLLGALMARWSRSR